MASLREQLERCKQELRDLNLKLVEGEGTEGVGVDVGVSVGGNDVGVGDNAVARRAQSQINQVLYCCSAHPSVRSADVD